MLCNLFIAVYGRDPPPLVRYDQVSPTNNSELEHSLQQRDLAIPELKEQLLLTQRCMKKSVNQGRRGMEFQEGDRVYLKLQPYQQKSLARRPSEKLRPRYYGPYKILQ